MTNRLLPILTAAAACAASLATAGASVAAPAPDAANRRASVRIIGDCKHAQYEPRQVIIACGDDGTFFKRMHYTSWTDRSATGSGQLWVNTDDPNGAAGNYAVSKVHFVMDDPKTVHGHPRFSRIVVHYTKHGKRHHEFLYPVTSAA